VARCLLPSKRRGVGMDFLYELVIRELLRLSEEARELRREAEEASRLPSPEPADEEDE
jgi:hypothetical protein